MDDDVDDLGKTLHQPIFHDVRDRMGSSKRGVSVNPEVQIDEHAVSRSARAYLFAPDDAWR
jgi:hypothetical protein